ncbi:MAG: DUF2905 domain-containing protein [Oligoflexia bacterium]
MDQMSGAKKFLLGVVIGLVAVALFWAVGGKMPMIGKLPGDLVVENSESKFSFPLTSLLTVSAIFSLVLVAMSWFRKR